MKFTRLRLLGFKSFVEPTDIVIEPGMSGVVGPNGCGKSNLVEAIRWVMGESSYKSMRASGMDDVIFSGSGGRPSRNSAEVTLVVDNSDRSAPAAFNDHDVLEVTRRIEREAGSVYKVNGKDVRARDVQLLFADASTGSRSPALVRQGQIGELINSKPTSRRRLLEEAAGISGLYSRRHEAELRLRAAETNLERLSDVSGQIESQLANLKRQARHAARYKAISTDIKQLQALLLHLKWKAVREGVASDERDLEQQVRLVATHTEQTGVKSKDRAIAASAMPALRDEEARTSAILQRLKLAGEALDNEEQRARQGIQEISSRIKQFEQDLAREKSMVGETGESLERLEEEEMTLKAQQAEVGDSKEVARQSLDQARTNLQESEAKLAALQSETADIKARRNQLDRSIREQNERLTRFAHQISEVERELAEIEADTQKNMAVQRLTSAITTTSAAVERSETASLEAETQLATARESESQLREPWLAAERDAQKLKTEVETLATVLNVQGSELWPPLIDAITVDKGLEGALGAALGDDLDAPTDEAAPAYWDKIDRMDSDPALPQGAVPLNQHVKAPAVLARRLAQIGLIDRTLGTKMQKLLASGQRLVSREGDLWRWDGYVAGAEAPTAAARRLAQRNRLADLVHDADAADTRTITAKSEFDASAATTKRLAKEDAGLRQSWRDAQAVLAEAREKLTQAERAASQSTARLSALKEAHIRLHSSLQETKTVKTEAQTAMDVLGESVSLDARLNELQNEVAQERAQFSEFKAKFDGIARETEMRQQRLDSIAKERESWKKRKLNADHQMDVLAERDTAARQELEKLSDVPDLVESKRRSLLSEISVAEEKRQSAADSVAIGDHKLDESDRASRKAEATLAESREDYARIESRLEAAKARRTEISTEISDRINAMPDQLLALAGFKPGEDLPEMRGTEEKLDKLLLSRERIGAVNLRAEEEAAEVEDQLERMTVEKDDLETAIRKLRNAIGQLNREGRERLLAAFDTVNRHFQELFKTLFGGGTAELQLTESDDPLEAGLEILARPPGKKPQTLSLLSGGEQALTAMALIFAVFLTNPAPICVLDEVDAPLDDTNVERFCNLIEEMSTSTDTRFIVITHHPITMSRMNRLFGVTMAERGVSQIVSVDLQTAERFREAI